MEDLGKFREEIVDILNIHNEEENQMYDEEELNLKKFEKLFVRTEEYITKILLKLDSIQSNGDETIRNYRKKLINWCNDYLDSNDKYKTGIVADYDTDCSSDECSE